MQVIDVCGHDARPDPHLGCWQAWPALVARSYGDTLLLPGLRGHFKNRRHQLAGHGKAFGGGDVLDACCAIVASLSARKVSIPLSAENAAPVRIRILLSQPCFLA